MHGPIRDINFRMPFGKYRGESVESILRTDPGYLVWVHENTDLEFHADIHDEATEASAKRPMDWYDAYQLMDKGLVPPSRSGDGTK